MTRRTPMWRRYATLFGRNIRRDIEDELEFHIDARVRELVAAGGRRKRLKRKPTASLVTATRSLRSAN